MASWTVARVRGIPVRLHWSLLAVLPFFAYVMAREYFPGEGVDATDLVWGSGLAVVLFLSVLLHELSHSLTAVGLGHRVESILLLPIGGVSQMESMPERPRDEFRVTVVGPLTNYAIAAPALAVHFLGLVPDPMTHLAAFVRWTGWLNVGIGTFNLFLPAFPMDGGRLLRAALAQRIGARRATHVAARVGRVLAFGMVLLGFLALPAGIWLMLIGLFIYLGAGAEESSTTLRVLLRDVRARDLMTPDPVTVAPGDSLEDVHRAMLRTRHTSFPVAVDDRVLGCIGLDELSQVERERLGEVRVEQVMQGEVPRVGPGTSAQEVFRLMQRSPHGHAVVVEDGRLVGVVSNTDVQRLVQVLDRLGDDGT